MSLELFVPDIEKLLKVLHVHFRKGMELLSPRHVP